MAAHTGWTIAEVDRAQKIWFGAHPGIKKWHERVKDQVTRHRFIANRFGYRWYIFDRIDSIIPEAIAWIPQSTVSVVINKIWMKIYETLPEAQVLLQVHDSLAGQYPSDKPGTRAKIEELGHIQIPYEDPLEIPFSVKISDVSWGDCE
jgi:DNA polymerase I-like protein with 3'-5' exonuclease and polymerase domains